MIRKTYDFIGFIRMQVEILVVNEKSNLYSIYRNYWIICRQPKRNFIAFNTLHQRDALVSCRWRVFNADKVDFMAINEISAQVDEISPAGFGFNNYEAFSVGTF